MSITFYDQLSGCPNIIVCLINGQHCGGRQISYFRCQREKRWITRNTCRIPPLSHGPSFSADYPVSHSWIIFPSTVHQTVFSEWICYDLASNFPHSYFHCRRHFPCWFLCTRQHDMTYCTSLPAYREMLKQLLLNIKLDRWYLSCPSLYRVQFLLSHQFCVTLFSCFTGKMTTRTACGMNAESPKLY